MTHLLSYFAPGFLELHERWVDAMLDTQSDCRDSEGASCLMYLLKSPVLYEVDLKCVRFRELLRRESGHANDFATTPLIRLCCFNK